MREAFEANLAAGVEVGAGVAVYHRGRPVVDLVGGWWNRDRQTIYDERVLQVVFSTTKGVTAIAVGMCVDRGLLDYQERVATYWPEFAAGGKGEVTVAQLLSHQAGLVSVDPPVSMQDILDYYPLVEKLAAQVPLWEPGTGHGYHAVTYGNLAGELVRRVDPQRRTVGRFVAEEICGPLGAEFWIGLPPDQEARVSPIIAAPPPDPSLQPMIDVVMGKGTLGWRALTVDGALGDTALEGDLANDPRFHRAELPGAGGIGTARALARIYAATIGPVDGVRLLSEATRDVARTTVTPENEPDKCLALPSTFGMGFMTAGMMSPYLGFGCYGHPGAGGSVAFAFPEAEVAFAYVMNQMDHNIAGDTRAGALMAAVHQVLAST